MGVGGDGIRQRAHNVAAVVAERCFCQALRRVERFPNQEPGAAELPQDGPAGEERLRRATPATRSAAASFRAAFPVASNLQQQLKRGRGLLRHHPVGSKTGPSCGTKNSFDQLTVQVLQDNPLKNSGVAAAHWFFLDAMSHQLLNEGKVEPVFSFSRSLGFCGAATSQGRLSTWRYRLGLLEPSSD